ncbi:MAG: dTDP-4-dehydrorhamnose reductase [Gammaproteobacteria bacterium]|nr:dTDP-4-dehydrorhamnose reductase [Gammaproteobacteria bacterium]
MKILVLGANGQVGRELPEAVRLSNMKDIEVIALDRHALDITRQAAVQQSITETQPSLVINAAAYTAVDKSEQEPAIAFAVNRDAPGYIAKACANDGIPLLHISTDYVFDGEKPGSYGEDDDVNPLGIYGQSKWEGEEAIRRNLEQYIILRTSWVFGVYGKNFVYTMINLARQREELSVVHDQHGCPTPARAIAITLLDISRKIADGGFNEWGTYHYCGQPATNWHHFAGAIINASQDKFAFKVKHINPISTREYPTPAKRPKNSVLNCDKIRNVFGIEQADWSDGLRAMLQHEHFSDAFQ